MSRIIAGAAKGRRLRTPAGDSTRPTTDRVREAVFATLASWAGTAGRPPEETLAGLSFCDLYAGSGAVGLEAASRGARPVLLVESDRRAVEVARRNVADTGLPADIRAQTVEQLVATTPTTVFDLIWADPPYDLPTDQVSRLIATLTTRWLAPDGLVVIERSARAEPPRWPEEFDAWETRYGETVVHFGQ